MEIKKNLLINFNNNERKKDWAKAFQEMAKNGDDELVIPDVFEDEDLSAWTWEEKK